MRPMLVKKLCNELEAKLNQLDADPANEDIYYGVLDAWEEINKFMDELDYIAGYCDEVDEDEQPKS